jgi:NitT/TauT family transport system substrate-binding protein
MGGVALRPPAGTGQSTRCLARRGSLTVALGMVAALVLAACGGSSPSSSPSAPSNVLDVQAAAIGPPPIYLSLYINVAQQRGFFKKVGVNVTPRYFQRGTDVAANVISGGVLVAATATQAVEESIAGGAPIVAISGLNHQDFFVASGLSGVRSCADLKGKTIAADGVNNARYLYLQSFLKTCGVSLSEVNLLNIANQALVQAAIAGQVTTAVYHIDELAQVEHQTGKKWNHMPTPASLESTLHYAMLITQRSAISSQREALVRYLAAWIMAVRWMQNPANVDAFAKIAATATGEAPSVATQAVKGFQAIKYWDQTNSGLTQSAVMSQLNQLAAIGALRSGKLPTYNQIVQLSLYSAAEQRANSVSS